MEHVLDAAHGFRVAARLDGCAAFLSPDEIIRHVGGEVRSGSSAGCLGQVTFDPLRVFTCEDLPPQVATRAKTHELGHCGLHLAGAAQSERAASLVGAAILLPREVLTPVMARCGWDAHQLVMAFPECPSPWPLMMAALHFDGAAILRVGRTRVVYAAAGVAVPRLAGAWERECLALARRSRGRFYQDAFGAKTWIMNSLAKAEWSVILLPPETLDLMGSHPDGPQRFTDRPANDGRRIFRAASW